MSSPESSRTGYQPDEHNETSGLRPAAFDADAVDPEIIKVAEGKGVGFMPMHSRAVIVEEADGQHTLVHRNMVRVHTTEGLTLDEAIRQAETVRLTVFKCDDKS